MHALPFIVRECGRMGDLAMQVHIHPTHFARTLPLVIMGSARYSSTTLGSWLMSPGRTAGTIAAYGKKRAIKSPIIAWNL